ncbi:MAG: helix-turn-helix domain-containing protein [Ruminococcaceae bacterium]|nr:helix-turn-helix domain-containing protein [Oscillospiraceae bacterium]
MTAISGFPSLLKKDDFLLDTPVYINRVRCETPDSAVVGLASLHQHQFIEVSCVLDGTGIHRIWNEAYPVSAGDLYILNTAVPHGYFSCDTESSPLVCNLLFDPADLFGAEINEIGGEAYLFGLFSGNNFAVHLSLKAKQLESFLQTCGEIETENREKAVGWLDAVRAKLTILLITAKRMTDNARTAHTYSASEESPTAAAALRMVRNRYADPDFSLADVAAAMYKSTSTVSRIFHAVTGEYFSDYLRTVRMRQAASLIANSDMSNEEIAVMCGYRDLPTFYKQFKQAYRATPGNYRKQYKETKIHCSKQEETIMSNAIYTEISEKLQRGKAKDVAALVTQALEENLPAAEILNEGLVTGMNIIGEKFRTNEVFVPEVLVAARAMNAGLKILKPALTNAGVEPIGRAVICTVKGDMHDIGKNLVKMMIEGQGIECIDLGVDADPAAIVAAVKENNAQLVCLSALLTTTMMGQRDVVEALKAEGIRDQVRVMVGGAPITQEFADEIGADCYTLDAASAAKEAVRLIGELKG